MDANNYDYITTSTTGKSTAIQIVDKKTGALYAILDGDYFDRESKYNTKNSGNITPNTRKIVDANKKSARKANESLFNLFK
jgi:hypothetical protein